MKRKIVTYENIELLTKTKQKCIEYLKNNPIILYWNYRDSLSLEQIKSIMISKDNYYELENEIYENCIDYICEMEYQLLQNMKTEMPELENFDVKDIRDEFVDFIFTDINMEDILKNTPDVNVRVVIHSNYEGVGYNDIDESEYLKQIKKLLKGKYDKKSLQQELDNLCSCCNQLIFYFKTKVENLIGIKEKFKKEISIPKDVIVGFFDSFNGSGSVLEMELKEDIRIKKQHGKTEYDVVDIILDETCKYSVIETYGLTGIPKCNIIVK